MVPKPMIIIGIVLLLGSWFLLVERQSFWEKIMIIAVIAVIYFSFQIMTGSTFEQAFAPIKYLFSR